MQLNLNILFLREIKKGNIQFTLTYLNIGSQVAIQAFFMTLSNNMDNNPKQKSENK